MRYERDKRVVMTLDAGGTNLVFSAVRGEEEIVQRISLSARVDNLELFLQTIIDVFEEVQSKLSQKPVAGLLPEVNALLAKSGSPKRYQNLFGATFGTGFGGGLSRAYPLFLQRLVDEMNTQYSTMLGTSLNRLEVKAFNLENKYSLMQFIKGDTREITVPFSGRKIKYVS